MRLHLVLLVSFLIAGCATTSGDSFDVPSNKGEVATKVYVNEAYENPNVKPVGKTVYFEVTALDSYRPAVDKLKSKFAAKGFVVTNKRSEAFVYVWIASPQRPARKVFFKETDLETIPDVPGSTGATEMSDTTTLTTYFRGSSGELRVFNYKGPSFKLLHGLNIGVQNMSYGKRPVTMWYQGIWAESVNEILISKEIEEILSAAVEKLVPGGQVADKKRPPGCVPRFGFEWDTDQSAKTSLKSITKNSPASKAGLKAGDEILAVDSVSIEEFSKEKISAPIYESLSSVPMKIKRNGKILRLNIKSQIMCD